MRAKTARDENSKLARVCRRFAARLREIGQRDHQQICRKVNGDEGLRQFPGEKSAKRRILPEA
jgi:hypothetical protein